MNLQTHTRSKPIQTASYNEALAESALSVDTAKPEIKHKQEENKLFIRSESVVSPKRNTRRWRTYEFPLL